eukprot:m.444955 g.444955  ORF g.444955 m.444955 type:complete len:73 (+) comp21489_c0_seq62:1694-1912(+)
MGNFTRSLCFRIFCGGQCLCGRDGNVSLLPCCTHVTLLVYIGSKKLYNWIQYAYRCKSASVSLTVQSTLFPM